MGAGAAWLAAKGWRVTAVDSHPDAVALLRGIPDIKVVESRLEEMRWEPTDLVLGFFSLFFLAPPDLEALWAEMRRALRPGGLFAGQLLGPGDDWVGEGYTGVDPAPMMTGFEVLHHEHHVRDGKTILGTPKHWDIHHVILRKP